ncbi:LD-carboxypeptidase, partial [bacterium]|nr:LD-carboxypeptidase [bacterium]
MVDSKNMNDGTYIPALKQGDLIRIISPAGPVDEEKLRIGVKRIESWGYKVEIAQHALDRKGFLAGDDDVRLKDLTDALLNDDVKGIICSRGGYGVLRLMKDIPWQKIAEVKPKPFVGFSDISAFQLPLFERCGWMSFSGPQAAMALSGDVTERTAEHLKCMLDGSHVFLSWTDGTLVKLEAIRSGSVNGRMLPCNLSMLNCLIGTEFMPDFSGKILCIEDISEPAYRIDRMLWQLEASGVFKELSSLIIGKFMYNEIDISEIVHDLALNKF